MIRSNFLSHNKHFWHFSFSFPVEDLHFHIHTKKSSSSIISTFSSGTGLIDLCFQPQVKSRNIFICPLRMNTTFSWRRIREWPFAAAHKKIIYCPHIILLFLYHLQFLPWLHYLIKRSECTSKWSSSTWGRGIHYNLVYCRYNNQAAAASSVISCFYFPSFFLLLKMLLNLGLGSNRVSTWKRGLLECFFI